MATQTYKVKKGDTLGGIAKNLGVSIDQISGYRSGNKNLIFPDETLTIGTQPKITQDQASKMSTKDLSIALAGGDYNTAVKDELGVDDGETSGYGSYETRYKEAEKGRKSAYEKLQGIATKTFEDEYKKRKLEDKKTSLSTLDTQIAEAKRLRDDAINQVRTNPGLSASQMTGDIAKLTDRQNQTINNLISQRNSVASEYNNELKEIDSIIGRATKDAELEYNYWDSLASEATGLMTEYEKQLREELKDERAQSNFEKQLAQQLQIAQMRKEGTGGGTDKSNWRLVYDDYGEPLYWYDPDTRAIEYINDDGGGGDDGDVNFDEVEAAAEEQAAGGGGGGGGGGGWWNTIKGWFS